MEKAMKNKEKIKRRIESIKHMEDPVLALNELADLTFEIGEDACLERAEIRELTLKNRKALIGNGDPLGSVVGRLASVENKVDCFANDIREMKGLLVGDVNQRSLSLKSRMEMFDASAKRTEKLQWFIVTAIIGYVVAQVLMAIF